jgi:hypothetical protein
MNGGLRTMSISSFLNEYGFYLLIGVVLLGLIGARIKRVINERKARKIQKKLEISPKPPEVPKEMKEEKTLPAFELSEYERAFEFGSKKGADDKTSREELIEEIDDLNKKMSRESEELDKKIKKDAANVENTLKEVVRSKQRLLEYGKEMSALYGKYEEREKQLGLTMVGLNRVIKEK